MSDRTEERIRSLSSPQVILLGEIAESGLYIRRWSRFERTVKVLLRDGLVEMDEHGGYGSYAPDHFVITDKGRRWLDAQ